MIKTYVVDTNVLIQAPYALNCFEDNQVVIPVVVLEELDNLKKPRGAGNNARRAIRLLEQLRVSGGSFRRVRLPGGGMLRIEKNFVDVKLPRDLPDEKADNRILKVCKGLAESRRDGNRAAHITGGGDGRSLPGDFGNKRYIAPHQGPDYRYQSRGISQPNRYPTKRSNISEGRRYLPRRSCLRSLRKRNFYRRSLHNRRERKAFRSQTGGKRIYYIKGGSVHKEDHAGESGEWADPGTGF